VGPGRHAIPAAGDRLASIDNKIQDQGHLSLAVSGFGIEGAIVQRDNTPPALHSTLTLINAGGPFVESLEEQSSNGIPTNENYALRYRGLLSVREQSVPLNQRVTSWIFDIKSLKSFVPLATSNPGTGSFDVVYETGNPIQIANLNHLAIHCTYGATYPAATLNPKLSGDAQEMACEVDNQNGVPSSHSVRVYLRQYGITVIKRNETSAATANMTIDDVRIE
jgi:hypothetical protein